MLEYRPSNDFFASTEDMVKAYQDQLALVERDNPNWQVDTLGRAKVVGWEDQKLQAARFSYLNSFTIRHMGKLPPALDISVLDVGCGLGDYAHQTVYREYLGVDVVPEFIEAAEENSSHFLYRDRRVEFRESNILDSSAFRVLNTHDLVIASGAFAYQGPSVWMSMLHIIWDLANYCVAFNILTAQTNPIELSNIAHDLGCDNYVIRRSPYPPDYTMYLYKSPKEEPNA